MTLKIKNMYEMQRELANTRFGLGIEILFHLHALYTNIFIIYFFEIDNLGLLILSATVALIMFSTHPIRVFESPTVSISTIILLYMLFVVGLAHGEVMMILFNQFVTLILYAILFGFLLNRPGFFKRAIITMYIVGVVSFWNADFSEYGRLEGGGNLTNSNVLASWMAYCSLGLAMWGFHARNLLEKIATWGFMFYGIVIVGLTVSRGALVALIFALFVFLIFYAPRSTNLVNIFITIMLISVGALAFTQTPTYKNINAGYTDRWDQQTGREELWPAALARIRQSPILGYGSHGLEVVTASRVHSSHNPFLTLGLIGGVFPPFMLGVLFVVGFFKMEKNRPIDGAFWLPAFFFFTFAMMQFSNWYFTRAWAILTIVAMIDYKLDALTTSEPEEQKEETLPTQERIRDLPV